MRLIFALFAFLFAPGVLANTGIAAIDEVVVRELPASGAPGVAYAVVDHGDVRAGGGGRTRANGVRAVTADTVFRIGSISKSFTALAIMQMAQSGAVDLDAGVATYLPAFKGHAAGSISLRQLLSHTSGYSTVQGNGSHGDDAYRNRGLAKYVSRVAQWQPAYPPGERWEYSNLNYQILGAVIEAVNGQDYADYIKAHIFVPLGMADSFVGNGPTRRPIAIGHRPWFGGKRPYEPGRYDRVAAPAGGIFASANDLARFLAMMLNGKDDIVSAANKAKMLRPANQASSFYGLGWFIDRDAGTAFHSGLVPGTETLATLLPAEGKAVVVLVNANGGIGFGDNLQLRNAITAKALGLEYAGEGSRLWPKLTYLMVMLLPVAFVACMAWAWLRRVKLRAKSGIAGWFSLWFPLLAMAAMAAVLTVIVPRMFGGSLGMLGLYQPDFALAMVATAALGPAWAIFRLVLAYGGRGDRMPKIDWA